MEEGSFSASPSAHVADATETEAGAPSAAADLFWHMLAGEPSDVHERSGYWRACAKYLASQHDIAAGGVAQPSRDGACSFCGGSFLIEASGGELVDCECTLQSGSTATVAEITPQEREMAKPDHSWRPIEAAPRDGTRVWLGGFGRGGMWCDAVCSWEERPVDKRGDELAFGWSFPWYQVEPTHWMPLPAPPGAEAPVAKESAAPDLLEALKGLLASIDEMDPEQAHVSTVAYVRAHEAIAKAEAAS